MNIEDIIQEFHLDINPYISIPSKPEPKEKFNLYFWWRRFPTHKNLPITTRALDKFKNGDFDYSPYWAQMTYERKWFAEEILAIRQNESLSDGMRINQEEEARRSFRNRMKKLQEDATLDEEFRMKNLKDSLRRDYGGTQEIVNKYIDECEGTIDEIINRYPVYLKDPRNYKNIPNLDTFFKIQEELPY